MIREYRLDFFVELFWSHGIPSLISCFGHMVSLVWCTDIANVNNFANQHQYQVKICTNTPLVKTPGMWTEYEWHTIISTLIWVAFFVVGYVLIHPNQNQISTKDADTNS